MKGWRGGGLRTFHKTSQTGFVVGSGPTIRKVYLLRETRFVRKQLYIPQVHSESLTGVYYPCYQSVVLTGIKTKFVVTSLSCRAQSATPM